MICWSKLLVSFLRFFVLWGLKVHSSFNGCNYCYTAVCLDFCQFLRIQWLRGDMFPDPMKLMVSDENKPLKLKEVNTLIKGMLGTSFTNYLAYQKDKFCSSFQKHLHLEVDFWLFVCWLAFLETLSPVTGPYPSTLKWTVVCFCLFTCWLFWRPLSPTTGSFSFQLGTQR